MCGIAGIIAPAPELLDLELMLALLEHRGPDGLGTHVERGAAIGATRLSIVDHAGGRQPMRHADTGVVIVFNGEVFNHPELRAELELDGYRFRTRSDTEVILALYLELGLAFPERLNGQFAVAIWDPRDQRLVLARDRFGICPLFYQDTPGRFAFASELKSILTLPQPKARLDLRALDQIFTFWTTVAGRTAIEGISELLPGHTLVHERGRSTLRSYWSWPFPGQQERSGMSFERALERFDEELSRAVALRLRADVEVGSYLSGGIDSSAIVALASESVDALRTYSVGFVDESYDEREHQELVARHCSTRHKTVVCRDSDIEGRFERVVWSAEMPLFRTAPAPMQMLSESVRADGLKAVLSGEGADEVLLGYDLFRETKIRRFWRRRPSSTQRPRLLEKLYSYLPQFANPRFSRLAIRSFGQSLESESPFYSHLIRWGNNAANRVYFSEAVNARLAGYAALDELEASLPHAYFAADELDRAQYLEIATLLRGYLLSSQGDRMNLSSSVEGRYPFLDHEFVAFANGLPRAYKLAGLRDKHILRRSMRARLPESICARPKFAYQAPDIRAFAGRDRALGQLATEYLGDAAVRAAGLFDPDAVAVLRTKVEQSSLSRLGARDDMAFVQMLSTHVFLRQFIEADVRALAVSRSHSLASRSA
ncbi:MAG: asparagine synthase (glutamine-hydrolyzing) [Planctomycetes bacterium]|nr:asparagine synthase (glutamine-hydrolyzing) [Planctomycetota bacterium]